MNAEEAKLLVSENRPALRENLIDRAYEMIRQEAQKGLQSVSITVAQSKGINSIPGHVYNIPTDSEFISEVIEHFEKLGYEIKESASHDRVSVDLIINWTN